MDDDAVPDSLRAKVTALKVCRNRCLAHADTAQALEIATPVLKLLATLVEHDGTLNPEVEEKCVYQRFVFSSCVIDLCLAS